MATALFDVQSTHFGNLADLCPVVAGGIVSKALLNEPVLRQILFAMDQGQQMSEHRAPYVATVQVLAGRLAFTIGGERRELGPHDWLVMPPNAPHDLVALEPVSFLLTLVKA